MVPWLKVACFPSLMEGVFDSQRSFHLYSVPDILLY